MHRLVCILWCAAVVSADSAPETSSNETFDPASFSSDFSELTESFKAKAISAVSDEVASYMDDIGVTALIDDIIGTHLSDYLDQTAAALDDMVDYFADSSVKDKLEAAVESVTGTLVTDLEELAGLVSAVTSSGTTAAAGKRTATAQAGSIGDVVVATVGLGISPSSKVVSYNGQDFSVSGSAGFQMQVGVDIATMTDVVVALGGGASVGFASGDIPTNTTDTEAKKQAKLSRMASVLADADTDSSLFTKLDSYLDATIGLDFFASTGDLTGFAYKVSVTLPAFSEIKELHVYLSHPQWGCLSVNPSAMYAPVVSGWGITLYSGKPSGMLAAAPGLWGSLDAASSEMADLKGTWSSEWGSASLMVGDTMTIADTGSLDLSDDACTTTDTSDTSDVTVLSGVASDVVSKVADVVSFIEASKTLILDASFTVPFCVGECSATPYDDESSLSGTATLKFTADLDGGEVDLYVDGITFGGLTTVIAEPLPDSAKDILVGMMDPLSALGLGESSVIVTVTTDGVSVTASGSPSFPDVSGSSAFEAVLRTLSDVVVVLKGTMTYSGDATLELDVGTQPDTSNGTFAIVTEDGTEGFALFAKAADEGELDIGVSLPIRICVESCSSASPRYLYLTGSLALELSGEEQNVEGELVMDGWWNEAFGIPFVNIADIILGIAMNLETFLPSKLDIGGTVCLGTWDDCSTKTGTYVEGRAYVGLDLAAPENSYYIMMISKLTFGTIFDLIGEYSSFVKDLDIESSFPALAESGIYPYDDSSCTTQDGTTVDSYNVNCYAYMSFNGAGEDKTLSFQDGDLVIPNGIAFSGKIDFFGWNFGVQAKVTETAFDIEATMDKVDFAIGGVTIFELGKYLSGSEVKDGAYFHVAADSSSGEILVQIDGAFAIPILDSYGELSLFVDADEFSFTSDIELFGGALTSKTSVQWNWDLTYFRAQLEDISFGGIVVIEDVHFEYNSAASSIDLGVSISVLSLISISAEVRITGSQIYFDVSADLALISIEVSGTAEIVTPMSDSSFSLHVSVGPGGLVTAIGDAVVAACDAIADVAVAAWDGLTAGVEVAYNAVKEVFSDALSAVADVAVAFFNGVADFFSDVIGWLEDIPVLGVVISAVADFFEDAWNSLFGETSSSWIVVTSEKNDYGCYIEYVRTKTCQNYLFWSDCDYSNGESFGDQLCMVKVAIGIQQVKIHGLQGQILQTQLDDSKASNKGLSDYADGATLQDAVVGNFNSTFPMDQAMPVSFPASVTVSQLTSTGITHGVAMPSSVSLDVSSEDALSSSHDSASADLASAAATFATKDTATEGISAEELLSLTAQIAVATYQLQVYLIEELEILLSSGEAATLSRDASVLEDEINLTNATSLAGENLTKYFPTFTLPVLQHTDHRESVSPCADMKTVLKKQQPHFRHVDKHCKKGAIVHLQSVEALSEFDTCEHVSKHKVEWVGVDGCGGVSEPLYTVVFRSHGLPSFVSVPDIYNVERLGGESGPRTTGVAGGQGQCGVNVTMSYEDSELHQAGSFWALVRTWTVALDVPDNCTSAQLRAVSQEQIIQFGNETSSLSCTASTLATEEGDANFDCATVVDGSVSLHWSILSGSRIFALQGSAAGYLAMGFPETSGTMGPGAAMIVTGGTAAKYAIGSDKDVAAVQLSDAVLSGLSGLTAAVVNGETVMYWTEDSSSAGRGAVTLQSEDTLSFNYAYHSSSQTLTTHTTRGSVEINLVDGTSVDTMADSKQSKVKTHAAIQTAVWAYVVPIAVLAKRFGPLATTAKVSTFPVPFIVHAVLMVIAIVLTIAMAALALAEFDNRTDMGHKGTGITVMCAAIMQALMQVAKPDAESAHRWIFRTVHMVLGLVTMVLACVTLFTGADNYERLYANDDSFAMDIRVAAITGLGCFFTAYVLLSALKYVREMKAKKQGVKGHANAPDTATPANVEV